MDRGTVLVFVSMAFMAIIRGLKEDLPLFRNLKGPGRALALAVLVAAAGAVDMMANQGTTLTIAFQTVLKTAGPSVLLLVVEWVGSFGGGNGGSAASGGGTSSLPRPSKAPTVPGAAMVSRRPSLGLMMWPANAGGFIVLGSLLFALIPGCGFGRALEPQIGPGLVKALQWEQDAQGKLEQVQAAINILVTDPKVRAAIQEKIDDVRAAIDVARSVTQGAKDLSDADLGGAYTEFRIAWQALVPLLKMAGFATPDGTRLMGAAPGTYHPPALPVPLALGRR